MSEWVSVKDRLPEEGKWVLTYNQEYENQTMTGFNVMSHEDGLWCDGDFFSNPTHWMPLPEPPK